MGGKLPSRRTNQPLGYKATRPSWIPSRENDLKANASSESGAEATVDTHEAEVFEENQAGEGREEQEGQR